MNPSNFLLRTKEKVEEDIGYCPRHMIIFPRFPSHSSPFSLLSKLKKCIDIHLHLSSPRNSRFSYTTLKAKISMQQNAAQCKTSNLFRSRSRRQKLEENINKMHLFAYGYLLVSYQRCGFVLNEHSSSRYSRRKKPLFSFSKPCPK